MRRGRILNQTFRTGIAEQIAFMVSLFVLLIASAETTNPMASTEGIRRNPVLSISGPTRGRFAVSVQAPDGTIYLLGTLKSTDGGKTLIACDDSDPPFGAELYRRRMRTFLWREGLFVGLYYNLDCKNRSQCVGKMWRSLDGMKTIQKEEALVFVAEGGKIGDEKTGGGPAIYFHRRLIEMPDGSLLACMMGNFEHDRIVPTDPRSRAEVQYKMRAFLVRSTDLGKTWHYLSTIAAPRSDVADDTEGFNESSIQLLADGRLFAVMRTGHYTPLAACWSSDGGKTWTNPATPQGLENGVDPYLLKLRDSRLALAYGQMMPRIGPKKEDYRQEDRRRACKLAINLDGTGETWVTTVVADYADRSAYPTIFEFEPNVIVYQSDLDLWHIEVEPPRFKR